jgi:Cof subfamily protein (haloacid dehalogenase superfamily)
MNFLFFDVDGTLLSEKGTMPESAVDALKQAKNRGHKIFLSTGRAYGEILPELWEINFDGMVICGGNTVYLDGSMIFDQVMDRSALQRVVDYLESHRIPYYCESNSGLYASSRVQAFLDDRLLNWQTHGLSKDQHEGIQNLIHLFRFDQPTVRDDVNKISFMGSDHPLDQLKADLEADFMVYGNFHTVFGANSGEVTLKGAHKGLGIQKILECFPKQTITTYGFGDSYNDVEMFDMVDVAVAMGNAAEVLKQRAHFITRHVLDDGLAHALKHLRLI